MKVDVQNFFGRVRTLYEEIKMVFRKPEARVILRERFREWCSHNGYVFLAALGISTLFYVWVNNNSIETFYENVRVDVSGVPPGETIGVYPPTVTVSFRGPSGSKSMIDSAQTHIEVEYPKNGLSDSEKKEIKIKNRNVKITGRPLRGMGSFSVVDIHPEIVVLSRDEKVDRTFTIDVPELIGKPVSGYAEIEDISPKTAVILGGSKNLLGLEKIGTKLQLPPISVEGKTTSFRTVSKLQLSTSADNGDLFTIDPPWVSVSVKIVEPPSSKTFNKLPVKLLIPLGKMLNEGSVLEPAEADVALSGAEDALSAVKGSEVIIYADMSSITNDFEDAGFVERASVEGIRLPLSVRVPADKTILDVNVTPQTVLFKPGKPKPEPLPEKVVITNTIPVTPVSTNLNAKITVMRPEPSATDKTARVMTKPSTNTAAGAGLDRETPKAEVPPPLPLKPIEEVKGANKN